MSMPVTIKHRQHRTEFYWGVHVQKHRNQWCFISTPVRIKCSQHSTEFYLGVGVYKQRNQWCFISTPLRIKCSWSTGEFYLGVEMQKHRNQQCFIFTPVRIKHSKVSIAESFNWLQRCKSIKIKDVLYIFLSKSIVASEVEFYIGIELQK